MQNNYTNEERAFMGLPPRGAAGANNNLGEYYAMLVAEAEAAPRNNRKNAINALVAKASRNFQESYPLPPGLTNVEKNRILTDLLEGSYEASLASRESANDEMYQKASGVLLSEDEKMRQSVLKIVALDDIIIEEKNKLAFARTDEERRNAAAKLHNATLLKEELDEARHRNEGPTAEQNARYATLTRNVDFNAIPYSLYPRLAAKNRRKTANNRKKAATKIAAFKRGYTARKHYKPTLNAMREARRAEKIAKLLANLKQQREEEAARLAKEAAERAEKQQEEGKKGRAAFLARFNKKPGQGGKWKTQRRRR